MGLIKKMLKKTAGVGLMIAGLPLSSWGLAIGGGITFGKADKDCLAAAEKECDVKIVCSLNGQYEQILDELESKSLKIDDVEVVFDDAARLSEQAKYEAMYNKFISAFGDVTITISKEEYVNFMLEHSEEVTSYVNSDEFKDRINKINSILESNLNKNDNLYTKETKKQIFKRIKEEIAKDCAYWGIDREEVKHNKTLFNVGQGLMITGLGMFGVGIVTALFFHFIMDGGDDLPTATGLFLCLPILSMIGLGLIIPGVTDKLRRFYY